MPGFFSPTTLVSKAPIPLIAQCGLCGLYKSCRSPKMPHSGKGERRILIVAEAPGETEDERGIQLIGRAGQRLERAIERAGASMRRDCWLTNTLICRPPGNEIKSDKWIDYCRPNLKRTIEETNPDVILLLGGYAVKSLIPMLWKDTDSGGITRWAGWQIPSQKLNAWICPTYHPSFCLRQNDPVTDTFFDRHVAAAFKLSGRPWKSIPNYSEQVQCVIDPNEAARLIQRFVKRGADVAFDYETTSLKPEVDGAEIVCCSISDGINTIAYPWHGKAIEATKELLRSPIGKIASNTKFEHRYSRAILGVNVRNWIWDTMQAAHVLDNREGISGLKFQAFVKLGVGDYDDHIKPYLKSKSNSHINRVKEVDRGQLLKYCGLDSLLEFKLSEIQRKEFDDAN